MGHLSLEKRLRGFAAKHTKAHAPLRHSLPYLAEKSGVKIPEGILLKLREFMEFHFEARYPDANKAFYKRCTKAHTVKKLKETKEVFMWVRDRL